MNVLLRLLAIVVQEMLVGYATRKVLDDKVTSSFAEIPINLVKRVTSIVPKSMLQSQKQS